ncbi:conserved hypothetical protein [Bathymodiolus platifrons methanotrophic gill symbiont]|uniref:glycosyltransferase n=1 Tax=Bathymodiolus platifrons methanotrophic gill symbiont TaxID=113268 RepID=UPI000B41DB6B|nr:glycosyltransferase [Bathymodiolus platifrons methanotrophic gill symbiont]GAW86674.1 conserved hypothetical protein [Bathymodiolus platifrons methanotrophic gill symbiont]
MSKNKYHFTLNTAEKNDSHMGLATRIKPNQRVLELGCSSGYLSRFLKEDLSCSVVGVDLDGHALQQARPFCAQTIVADLDSNDWLEEIKGQQFDVVLCADVLEHLKNPAVMLASLKPFLHAESCLLASVPNVAHASIRLELLQGHFDYESLGLLDDTHLHFYTRDGLVSILMEAGYVCSDISYSVHDLADAAIDQHLANAGLECTVAARKLLHAPDAVAFQYIIEAHPAPSEIELQLPQPLSPKPLVSSGVAYREKQERIDYLEYQLGIERAQQGSSIQRGSKATELDDVLFAIAEQLQQERERNSDLSSDIKQLEDNVTCLTNDRQQLERVLQRVHGKISYRLVRGIKDIPRAITGLLRKSEKTEQHSELDFFDYESWLAKYDYLTEQSLLALEEERDSWEKPPKIALLMPVCNPDRTYLLNAINSILLQVYDNFELCIADDALAGDSVCDILRPSAQDSRIKVISLAQRGLASAANSALSLVEADYVCLVGQHDLLAPDALYWIVKSIQQEPDAQLIYSDEDKISLQGKRYEPYFKPDWNPELFLSHNYIKHLCVYKTQQVKALGGYNLAFGGAQDYDLALRYVAGLKPEQIVHIPRVLYHGRIVSGRAVDEQSNIQAVKHALQHKQRPAEVTAHQKLPGVLRVRYLLPDSLPLVSIVIPTRNGFHLLYRCVESIFAKTAYINYELIIIDNGSDDVVTVRYLQRLQQDPRVTVIRDDSVFNYSALNNKAVAQAQGKLIALLNNDLEVINSDWLDEMVSHAIHLEVGAVGAKLYYPDDTIQHAGVIVGLGGVAGHSHKHFPRDNPGYCARLLLAQNLSAVTAACLLVRKEVFDAVSGFDEKNLAVAFNDVDFCLRIQEQGYQNVWTPYAELYHYESASRGYEDTPEKQARFNSEIAYMKLRWGESLLTDPAYSPNLTQGREDFSFAWPPRV